MIQLPFRALRYIEQTLSQIPLNGLVLILTAQEGKKGLAIYLDEHLPQETGLPWAVKPLSKFNEDDWLAFDGLAAGYDALDVHFNYFQTHGPFFYDLQRLFTALAAPEVAIENARSLARWLAEQSAPSTRRDQKLVSLLFPFWMRHSPPPQDGAIGLEIGQSNFPAYLDGDAFPHWLKAGDLSTHPGVENWIFTFAEARGLLPAQLRFSEWRPMLQRGGYRRLYRQGLLHLAQALWRRKDEQETWQNLAWDLALEHWLPRWASADLLAVQPQGDFETFCDNGSARLIFRTPLISAGRPTGAVEQISWNDFLNGIPSAARQERWFALSPLHQRIQDILQTKTHDLTPIWLQSGLSPFLVQSLLGVAEDLREGEMGKNWPLSRAEIVRLSLRGFSLAALSNPWAREWGGRYGDLLEEAYFLIDDVLLQAEQQSVSSAERSLFAFLRHWYGMYAEKGENFIRRWHQVLEARMNAPKEDAAWPDVGMLQQAISHFADPSQRFEPVETEEDFLLISERFVEFVQKWSETHRHIGERLTLEFLDSQLKKYRCLRRSVYALPHEQRVLRHFIDQDIHELERLRAALRGKVVVQARLLTNPILLDSWTQLVVEIKNVGAHLARNLKFELVTTGPDLLEKAGGSVLVLPVLPARSDWQRLTWQIRLREDPGELELVCRFEEDAAEHVERFSLPVNVLRRAGKGQRPQGGNRFQAGIPVSGRQFFGRERELKIIFDFLLGDIRQPVILRGPRRIGKTSILHQIEYLLKQEGELQRLLGYSREEEAYIRRLRPVSTSLQKIQGEEGLSRWLFQLYRGMAETVGEKVEIPANEFQAEPFFVFEDLLSQSLFPRFPEARWLILLDEWDEGRHVHGLPGKLRALMQRADFTQLQWVFASTWMLSEEAGRFGSPFFSQCKAIELSALTWKDARRLVLEISRKMNVEWEGAALLRLLDQTALRPYLIQRVGQDVIQHLSDSQPPSNFVDLETLDTVLSKVIRATSDPTSPFAFLWPEKSKGLKDVQETRLTGLGRMILLGLSEEKRPLTLREIVQSLQRHLLQRGWEFPGNDLDVSVSENLINLGRIFDVIARQPDKRFAFSIPLAQAWFEQRVQSIEDPWQVAWEQLCQEYRVRRSAKEAQE